MEPPLNETSKKHRHGTIKIPPCSKAKFCSSLEEFGTFHMNAIFSSRTFNNIHVQLTHHRWQCCWWDGVISRLHPFFCRPDNCMCMLHLEYQSKHLINCYTKEYILFIFLLLLLLYIVKLFSVYMYVSIKKSFIRVQHTENNP